jgi:CheY-like chemotaxis protein
MNAVVGMTGLLLDTRLDAEQRDFVETIRSSGDALLTIINDILDFSKIDSGKMELEAQPFDVRVCVEEALDLLAGKGTEKGLEMAYTITNDVPARILGDVTRTRQILVNLLGNAIKFTHAGEVIVSLESTPDPQVEGKHELHFAVRDTGIGIPADRLERLFQSFHQVDASTTRKYGGTGLGLAISKCLSEMMGGTMWIESQVGLGSTFHFTMTAQAGPPPEPPLPPPPPEALRAKRLLVVDDNATNRRILRMQAETWGMEVRTASGGPLALEWLRAGETFDLAVLDMQMPEMDGLELATEMRKLHDASALPLVLLTSMGKAFLRDRATEAEAFSAFLSKPVKPSQLHAVLLRVITGQEVNSAVREGTPRLDTGLAERAPMRILLAEDNVVNQKVATRILERLGYRADVVANGVEAVAAVRQREYDIVLMDVMMPEMDGLQATRQICADVPPQRRPRIVAMTANAMQGDREVCLEAGMDDYISKPVRPEELQAALERSAAAVYARGRAASITDAPHAP